MSMENRSRSRSPSPPSQLSRSPRGKSPILLPSNKPILIPNKSNTIMPTRSPPRAPIMPSNRSRSPPRSPTISNNTTRSLIPTKNVTKKEVDIKNVLKINEIVLKEWQVEWRQKAHDILLSSKFYIDTSPMRSGKTFVALKLAKDFDLELFPICPPTTKSYWKNLAKRYGVKLFTDPVNYEALVRGTKNEVVQLYLTKKTNRTHTFYEVTEAYKKALKTRKILLILDEAQMIKNDNQQHKACNALIEPIITTRNQSRFGILSGTLIDKPEQIINLLRIIGYIRSPKLYTTIKGSKKIQLEGAQELIDVCKQINPVGTTKFLSKTPIPIIEKDKKIKDEVDNFCFALYIEVIKPKVAGAMSAPTTAEGELYVRNGYFHILPEKANELKIALNELKFSSGYKSKKKLNVSKSSSSNEDDFDDDEKIKSKRTGNYIKSLVEIEKSKLLDMARVAKKILSSNDTNKVIIAINYTGPDTGNLEELLSYLTEFDPLVIIGKTTVSKRDIIIDEFNLNPDKRILIANPKPISVGISLVGEGQRYMLVSPSPKLMEIVQLSSRIYSDNLKVDSYVYIFYAIGDNLEANILQFMGTKKLKSNKIDDNIKDILEKKSDTLGKMQENEIRKTMKLPSDYEDEYEDEDEVFY